MQTAMLLGRVREGDGDAGNDLFARYRTRLERFVGARMSAPLRRQADAEDLVQEVFLRAHTALPRFQYRGIGSFWAFLRTIALHLVIEMSRKRDVRTPADRLADGSRSAPQASGTNPSALVVRHEQFEAFEHALQVLDPRSREALLLRIELDFDYATIASECGFPSPDAARMAVARGLKAVAAEMSRHGVQDTSTGASPAP